MKITIALLGRFGAFNFAEQLERHNALHRLVTVYPKYFVQRWKIPEKKICSLLWLGVTGRCMLYLPAGLSAKVNRFCILLFDFFSALFIPKDSDILIGWSNCCLNNLKKAKKRGIVTVLVRGSAHILDQNALVRAEYSRWAGIDKQIVDEFDIRRELAGYEVCDYILVPSGFAKRSFVEHGFPPEKILMNPYGVDLKMFHRLPKTDHTFRIICCGALSLEKGVQYLLEAFRNFTAADAELWLIGGMTPQIQTILSQYPDARVCCKGTFPQTELYKLFSMGSVFVQYSVQDGFAMTIVQAMACGLPVICSVNTGGPDVLKDGVHGFIIPVCDSRILQEKIQYLYDHPEECQAMGRAAEQHAIRNNSWDLYGDRADQIYRKILEARKGDA